MSAKAKKQRKKSKTKHDFPEEAAEMKDSAISFLGEVEKSGEKLANEVKHFFEQLADHVSTAASSAAKKTASVKGKMAGADPTPHLSRALDEVKEAGEASLRAVGEGFDALRHHVTSLTPSGAKTAKKAAARKKTVEKKVSASKPVARKKPAAKKKVAARKVVKKPAAKKKVSAKKKGAAKKVAAKTKVSAKKVVKKPV